MTTTKTLAALAALLALASCGGCTEVYERRAVKAEAAEDYASAIRWWDKVVERRPDYIVAYMERGVDKSLTGNERGAIEDYSKAIELDSTYLLAYVNRASCRYDLGGDALAVADFNAAVRIKGGDEDGNLPMLYAERVDNPIFASDPHDISFSEIRYHRGWAYYGLDSLRRAFDDFNYCIERSYLLDECYFICGEIYERYGLVEKAIGDYEASLRHAPSGSGIYTGQATERLRILKDGK